MEISHDERGNPSGWASGELAVTELGQIIRQHAKFAFLAKVLVFCLAVVILLVSAILMVFAPNGRESQATLIAVGGLICAAGLAGFAQFKLKGFGVEASVANLSRQLEAEQQKAIARPPKHSEDESGPQAAA